MRPGPPWRPGASGECLGAMAPTSPHVRSSSRGQSGKRAKNRLLAPAPAWTRARPGELSRRRESDPQAACAGARGGRDPLRGRNHALTTLTAPSCQCQQRCGRVTGQSWVPGSGAASAANDGRPRARAPGARAAAGAASAAAGRRKPCPAPAGRRWGPEAACERARRSTAARCSRSAHRQPWQAPTCRPPPPAGRLSRPPRR